ncbi:VOC family protein [Escherichia coli]
MNRTGCALAVSYREATVAREKRYPHEGWEHIEIVCRGDPETLNARVRHLPS